MRQPDARADRPLTEEENLRGIMALSTIAALKALEISSPQAWLQQMAQFTKTLHCVACAVDCGANTQAR